MALGRNITISGTNAISIAIMNIMMKNGNAARATCPIVYLLWYFNGKPNGFYVARLTVEAFRDRVVSGFEFQQEAVEQALQFFQVVLIQTGPWIAGLGRGQYPLPSQCFFA
jgi:hypothetical protein